MRCLAAVCVVVLCGQACLADNESKPVIKPTTAQRKEVEEWLKVRGGRYHGSEAGGLDHILDLEKVGTDEHLKQLPPLKFTFSLKLTRSKVTDEGLKHLKDNQNLRALILRDTGITDEGVKQLAGLKNLDYLSLERTKITDVSMKIVGTFKDLYYLELGKTAITDAAIPDILRLKKLKFIDVKGSKITKVGEEVIENRPRPKRD